MSPKLWWLYVPWVRKRRLARIDRGLRLMRDVIANATDEELLAGIVAWHRKRTSP